MGVIKGSISFTRFFVWGELPETFRDDYLEAIHNHAFRPLVAQEDDEEHRGWCAIDDPFDLDLTYHKVFNNSFLNLGLRVDRWKIPAPTLKAHLAQAERTYMAEQQRERLSRQAKEEIRLTVMRKLRSRVFPIMKVFDMSWDLTTGVIRLWSNASKVHDQFQDLFRDTFDLHLVPEGPYTTALRIGLSESQAQTLESLEPEIFHSAELNPELNPAEACPQEKH